MIHDLRTFLTCFMKYEVIEDLSEKKKEHLYSQLCTFFFGD